MIKRLFPVLFLFFCLTGLPAAAQNFSSWTLDRLNAPVAKKTDSASKISLKLTRGADGAFKIIVHLKQNPGLHVYWKNAGETGYPLTIQWQNVPADVQFGEWRWSVPRRDDSNGITSFVYGENAFIEIPVSFEKPARISGNASWLLCDDNGCNPCDARVSVDLKTTDVPATDEIVPPEAFPKKNPALKARSFVKNGRLTMRFSGLAAGERAKNFFPDAEGAGTNIKLVSADETAGTAEFSMKAVSGDTVSGVLETDRGAYETTSVPAEKGKSAVPAPEPAVPAPEPAASVPAPQTWLSWTPAAQAAALESGKIVYIDFTASWCATCQVNKRVYGNEKLAEKLAAADVVLFKADWTRRDAVIAAELEKYKRSAVPVNVFKKAGSPDVVLPSLFAGPQTVADGLDAILAGTDFLPEKEELPFGLAAFVLAFTGGLILNLMPCVFPVLGLKIMHFANNAGQNKKQAALHGFVFAAGVLISFWALAGLLIALRAGGEQLGWGFQMQSPVFVLCMTVLLLVFGLSLSGVFEFGAGATAVGGELTQKSGFAGTFFSGVLAVIVATPCSAPFLAQALGTALTLPPAESLALFTAIALGLAAPYLVLSCAPQWLKFLPRPGAWMETFKQAMAFLLYAPAVYFAWVLMKQIDDGLSGLCVLLSFCVIAFACWLYGRFVTPVRSRKTRILAGTAAFVIFAGTLAADIAVTLG